MLLLANFPAPVLQAQGWAFYCRLPAPARVTGGRSKSAVRAFSCRAFYFLRIIFSSPKHKETNQ
jgi:hypothetical protein